MEGIDDTTRTDCGGYAETAAFHGGASESMGDTCTALCTALLFYIRRGASRVGGGGVAHREAQYVNSGLVQIVVELSTRSKAARVGQHRSALADFAEACSTIVGTAKVGKTRPNSFVSFVQEWLKSTNIVQTPRCTRNRRLWWWTSPSYGRHRPEFADVSQIVCQIAKTCGFDEHCILVVFRTHCRRQCATVDPRKIMKRRHMFRSEARRMIKHSCDPLTGLARSWRGSCPFSQPSCCRASRASGSHSSSAGGSKLTEPKGEHRLCSGRVHRDPQERGV